MNARILQVNVHMVVLTLLVITACALAGDDKSSTPPNQRYSETLSIDVYLGEQAGRVADLLDVVQKACSEGAAFTIESEGDPGVLRITGPKKVVRKLGAKLGAVNSHVADEPAEQETKHRGPSLRVLSLKHSDARVVAATLNALQPLGSEPLTIVPDASSNALLVKATDAGHREVERIVGELDVRQDSRLEGNTPQVALIRLEHAVAKDVAQVLNRARDAWEIDVEAIEDARTNSVVIAGSPSDVERAGTLVKALDVPVDRQQGRQAATSKRKSAESEGKIARITFDDADQDHRKKSRRTSGGP